jgi:hypothetical protein
LEELFILFVMLVSIEVALELIEGGIFEEDELIDDPLLLWTLSGGTGGALGASRRGIGMEGIEGIGSCGNIGSCGSPGFMLEELSGCFGGG